MSETTFESTHFIIHGPTKMSGEITANGAKNSALALTMAALMTTGRTVLKNIPKIEELKRFAEIFESIGAKIVHEDDSVLIDVPAKLSLNKMNFEAAKRTRAALMLMGALAAREKKFKVPFSGGCRLGRRTVRPHIYALENLGVKIDIKDDCYEIDATKLKGAEVIMYEAGDTPTENAIMAAVMAPGQTIIRYASANYQVQDLCYFLNAMGAKISGIGTTVLSIEGVKKLKPITYHIINDPIEAMSFIAMAATTNSEITIKGIPKSFLELELEKLKRMNWKYKIIRKYKSPSGNFDFIDICTKKSKLIASPEKLHAQPYPGLNMDNLPVFAPICTQAKGTTLIHDWTYENRAIYLTELSRLGAEVQLLDPHRVQITGPSKLKAAQVMCPAALRAGMVMLIAMLAAEGESVLRDIYMINRGYEDLPGRLKKLGVKISHLKTKRIDDADNEKKELEKWS